MDWSDLGKNIIKFGAPILGGVVGGPAGAALGGTIAAVFGANPGDPKDIYKKMKSDPDAAVKLLQIQSNERIRIEEVAKENFEIEVADRKSARKREENLAKSGERDYTPAILVILLTIGFFGLITLLIFVKVQPDALTIIKIMVGSLGSAWLMGIAYYFGSSSGSKKKDDMLRSQKL